MSRWLLNSRLHNAAELGVMSQFVAEWLGRFSVSGGFSGIES